MVSAIIFDLGNVIVDVNHNKMWKKFAQSGSHSTLQIKNYYNNSASRKIFETGKISPREFYNRMAGELRFRMSFSEFKNAYCDIFTLNNNVAALLKKLKKKYKLILLSNTDSLHFNYIKTRFKIVNIFDEYILSFEVGCRKPNPRIFLIALKKAKTLPSDCVYIDDIIKFIRVAKLLGIKAFQYHNYTKLINDLKRSGVRQ